MSLELLKSNINEERNLVRKLSEMSRQYEITLDIEQKKLIENAIFATKKQIAIINSSIPSLMKNVSMIKRLETETQVIRNPIPNTNQVIRISHETEGSRTLVGINKKDKDEYLKQLQISETSVKNLKKKRMIGEAYENEFKKPSKYASFANRLFSKTSNKLIAKGYFNSLRDNLRKGNFMILLNSYVSSMFLTTLIVLVFSIIIALFFLFFSISFEAPYIYATQDLLIRFVQVIWIIPVVPAIVFLILYIYPSLEKSSQEKNIDYELPFATIQMAAIAGSDIEPSNIFKIIALSKEYPAIRQEAKKLMNQINLYGYDLVNALRNVAMASPSKEWAELLNGFSTTIRSGGDLAKYLNKRAETLLFEYRLKKEKATKSAETFMDIYISVVIAAPMLLMLLLIMINVSGIGFSMPIWLLTFIVVSVISLINIIFLVFLHLNQKRI
ncbi:MAG: type II secretion system F family protein [Candidatus Pacearchaeota archaeon]|jgi:pilus assembly protein TadC